MRGKREIKAALILAALLVIIAVVVRVGMRGISVANSEPAAARAAAPVIPRLVQPVSSDTSRDPAAYEYERAISLIGLLPFQSDASLDEIGAVTSAQKSAVNALFESTAMMVVESVVAYGETRRENGVTRIAGKLPEATHGEIRAQFYRRLGGIIGAGKLDALVRAGPIERIENELLGFGENPIEITARDAGGKVAVTFATQHGGDKGSPTEFYHVSQTLDRAVFAATFPGIARAR